MPPHHAGSISEVLKLGLVREDDAARNRWQA